MEHTHIIDLSIVIAYLLMCLALGFKKFGQVKTLRDYTLGDRPFTTFVLVATMFATTTGAYRIVGNVGLSYSLGITHALTMCTIPVGWFLMGKILSNHINFFQKKRFLTLGDIMEYYYGKFGRHLSSVAAIILTLGLVAAGSMAIGKLGQHFFGIPEIVGMLIALSIVTIYSTIGGFCAVVATDVFQFLVFFIVLSIACFIGHRTIGGYQNILQSLPTSHFTIDVKDLGLFLSGAFIMLITPIEIPYIQRVLVIKNKYHLQKVFNYTGLLMLPLFVLVGIIGFMTYVQNPNLQQDTVLYYFVEHYLPAGAIGLMIAGLLAVIMSTQDSYLNTTSTLVAKDICKQIWPNLNAKQELLIARSSCIVLAITSVFLISIKEDIPSLILLVYNYWAPLVTAPLLMAFAGVRIKKELFIIVPIVTLIAIMFARQAIGVFDFRTATIGVITAAITILILSRINGTQRELTK